MPEFKLQLLRDYFISHTQRLLLILKTYGVWGFRRNGAPPGGRTSFSIT